MENCRSIDLDGAPQTGLMNLVQPDSDEDEDDSEEDDEDCAGVGPPEVGGLVLVMHGSLLLLLQPRSRG